MEPPAVRRQVNWRLECGVGWGRRGWDGVAVKLPVGQFKASIVSRRVSLITVVRLPCGIRIGYWYRWRPIVLGIGYALWYRSNPRYFQ